MPVIAGIFYFYRMEFGKGRPAQLSTPDLRRHGEDKQCTRRTAGCLKQLNKVFKPDLTAHAFHP